MDTQNSTARMPRRTKNHETNMHIDRTRKHRNKQHNDTRRSIKSPSSSDSAHPKDALISAFIPQQNHGHHGARDHKFAHSRIPRATPSPSNTTNNHISDYALSATKPKQNTRQKTRIPRPKSSLSSPPLVDANTPTQYAIAQPPLGYAHSFTNPSYNISPDAQQQHHNIFHKSNNTNRPPVIIPPAPSSMPLANAIATPEALNLIGYMLDTADTTADHQDHHNTSSTGNKRPIALGLVNAYLRTGPQKLSPEPSKDQGSDIVPPGPIDADTLPVPAVVNEMLRTKAGELSVLKLPLVHDDFYDFGDVSFMNHGHPHEDSGAGVSFTAVAEVHGAMDGDDDIKCIGGYHNVNAASMASSKCSNFAECGEGDGDKDSIDDGKERKEETKEIRFAAPVAHHHGTALLNSVRKSNKKKLPKKADRGILRGADAPPSTVKKQVRIRSPDARSTGSSSSFSFGMVAGDGKAVTVAPVRRQQPQGKKGKDSSQIMDVVDSGDINGNNNETVMHRVDFTEPQNPKPLNPFSSMLDHLREGGPTALISPAGHAMHHVIAPWMMTDSDKEIHGRYQYHAVADTHNNVERDSPCSPQHCTPMHLLPEKSSIVSVTPELGKGNLQAWIDRRGLRDALNSPAAADLQRLWSSVRDATTARFEVDAVHAKNDALQRDLDETKQALVVLGQEHSAAVHSAEAGKQWAMAELARAQYVAQQMMLLANQIQATFMLCEQEKAMMAQQLEEAWRRAEQAEEEAYCIAEEMAVIEEEIGTAQSMQDDAAAARRAADHARAEADEFRRAAAVAAEELVIIRSKLHQAQVQLAVMKDVAASIDDGGEGKGDWTSNDAAVKDLSPVKAQLAVVHDALANLHSHAARRSPRSTAYADNVTELATGSSDSGDDIGRDDAVPSSSPDLDQLFASCAQGLGTTKDILHHFNDNHSTIIEINNNNDNITRSPMKYINIVDMNTHDDDDDDDVFSSPQHRHVDAPAHGTVTLEYHHLPDILTLHALLPAITPPSPARPPSPAAGRHDQAQQLQGCYDVHFDDAIKIANIPRSEASRVHSMINFFESLTMVDPHQHDEEDASSLEDDCGNLSDDNSDAEQHALMVREDASTMDALDAHCHHHHNTHSPDFIEDDGERYSVFLPDGTPVRSLAMMVAEPVDPRDIAVSMNTFAAAATPKAPTCTPANDATPQMQRRHMQTMQAFATLQQQEHQQQQQRMMAMMQHIDGDGGGDDRLPAPQSKSDLQLEVRTRLQKLKGELEAARRKLSNVDKGLAAIASPSCGTPTSANVSSSRRFSIARDGSGELLALLPPPPQPPSCALEGGVAAVGPSLSAKKSNEADDAGVTPKTVRFADDITRSARLTPVQHQHDALRGEETTPLIKELTEEDIEVLAYPSSSQAEADASWMRLFNVDEDDDDEESSRFRARSSITRAAAMRTIVMQGSSTKPRNTTLADNTVVPSTQAMVISTLQRRLDLDSSDEDDDDDDDDDDPYKAAAASVKYRTPRRCLGGGATLLQSTARMPSRSTFAPSPIVSRCHSSSSSSAPFALDAPGKGASSTGPLRSALALSNAGVGVGGGYRAMVRRGGRKPSDSEEKEFRRRAAALKIHVSPYFNRKKAVGRSPTSSP